MNHLASFPTFGQLFLQFLKSLDLKRSNTKLDRLVNKLTFPSPNELDSIITESLEPLKSYSKDLPNTIIVLCSSFKEEYAKDILKHNVCGLDQNQIESFLFEKYFLLYLDKLITGIQKEMPFPEKGVFMFMPEEITKKIFDWYKSSIPDWNKYYSAFFKEEKDKHQRWIKEKELPSEMGIKLFIQKLKKNGLEDSISRSVGLTLLLSRSVSWFLLNNKHIDKTNYLIKPQKPILPLKFNFSKKSIEIIQELNLQLGGAKNKSENDITRYSTLIADLEKRIKTETKESYSEFLWIPQYHTAKLRLLSGCANEAIKLYKKVFYAVVYRVGIDQKRIFRESLILAAYTQNKVFLNQLKYFGIHFGLFAQIEKNDQEVQDWEIIQWSGEFKQYFKKEQFLNGLYPKTKHSETSQVGPPYIIESEKFKPDYRNINRRFKYGGSNQLIAPQIIYFMINNNYEIFERLLKKGADINVFSSSMDTPLLISLQAMNVTNSLYSITPPSFDERYFKLITKHKHHSKTVNQTTIKQKLLPLMCAIETGRIDFVERLLTMGVEVDKKSTFDQITPLYNCIQIIGLKMDKDKHAKMLHSNIESPQSLESIRRTSYGVMGLDSSQISEFMNANKNSYILKKIKKPLICKYLSIFESKIKRKNLVEIAKMLLKSEASPNIINNTPRGAFTPMMLAAELDLVDLFSVMLEKHKGSPFLESSSDRIPKFNCWDVAYMHKSYKVISYLRHKFQKNHSITKR
jgi:hypothetical protein